MASTRKLPFEPNRYDKNKKAGNNNLKVAAVEKDVELTIPIVISWGDDSSWEDYKSRTSGSTQKRQSSKDKSTQDKPQVVTMTDEIKTPSKPKKEKKITIEKLSVAPKVFESELAVTNDSSPDEISPAEYRRFSVNPNSIVSGILGLQSMSMSSLATSEGRQMSPTEAMYLGLPYGDRPHSPLKYTTLKFNNEGVVDTTSTTKSSNERVVHYPVGEFYKPHKLSKSITLPSLSRPSVNNFSGSRSLASLASAAERSGTADELLNELTHNYPGSTLLPEMNDDDENILPEETVASDQEHSSAFQSSKSDSRFSPRLGPVIVPPVPYQIHNRVLGSKLLPLVRNKTRCVSPGASRGIDAAMTEALTEAPAVPFQVHKRIMGWKLTSAQRRRELVNLLDVVNSTEENGTRLRKAFEEQGISTANLEPSSPPKNPEQLIEEQKQLKQTSKRMAMSWERTVSRMIKARVGALDGKAEFQKQKVKREVIREQRRQQMLNQSFSPGKYNPQASNFFDSDHDFEAFSSKQSLLHGKHATRDLMKPSIDLEPTMTKLASDAGLSSSLAHNIRALSPPMLRPVETYSSTTDLLVLTERLDILRTADMLRKGMQPVQTAPTKTRVQTQSSTSPVASARYHASFLDPRNAPRSPVNVRVSSPTLFPYPVVTDHGMYSRRDDDDDMTMKISLTSEVPLLLNPKSASSLYSLSVEPLVDLTSFSHASKIHNASTTSLLLSSEPSIDSAVRLSVKELVPPEPLVNSNIATDSQLFAQFESVGDVMAPQPWLDMTDRLTADGATERDAAVEDTSDA